jgi:hypothetical protein
MKFDIEGLRMLRGKLWGDVCQGVPRTHVPWVYRYG